MGSGNRDISIIQSGTNFAKLSSSIIQTLKLLPQYLIIDSIQDFRAEDSFIHRKNKLAQYKGNGESKKHVGTYKGEKGDIMSNFFDYSTWGLEHYDSTKKRKTSETGVRY